MDAVAASRRNPVSKYQIPPEVENEQAGAGRDGRTPFLETKFSGASGDRKGKIIYPV